MSYRVTETKSGAVQSTQLRDGDAGLDGGKSAGSDPYGYDGVSKIYLQHNGLTKDKGRKEGSGFVDRV